jgi:hypothetical protein
MSLWAGGASSRKRCAYSLLACTVAGQFLEIGKVRSNLDVNPIFVSAQDTVFVDTPIERSSANRHLSCINVESGLSSTHMLRAANAGGVNLEILAPPLLSEANVFKASRLRRMACAVLTPRPNVLAASEIEVPGLTLTCLMNRSLTSLEMAALRRGLSPGSESTIAGPISRPSCESP